MNLRELRFQKNLIQHDLQLKSGIPQSRISLIERGYVVPTDSERARIAKAVGVRPEDLDFALREVD